MGSLPNTPAEPTLVEVLRKALVQLTLFRDAAADAKRRQERRVAGDVWSAIEDMRERVDRADSCLFQAHLLLPEGITLKALTAVASAINVWLVILTELANPRASLRSPDDRSIVVQAHAQSCLWILVVRHALHAAERAQAGSAEVRHG